MEGEKRKNEGGNLMPGSQDSARGEPIESQCHHYYSYYCHYYYWWCSHHYGHVIEQKGHAEGEE